MIPPRGGFQIGDGAFPDAIHSGLVRPQRNDPTSFAPSPSNDVVCCRRRTASAVLTLRSAPEKTGNPAPGDGSEQRETDSRSWRGGERATIGCQPPGLAGSS